MISVAATGVVGKRDAKEEPAEKAEASAEGERGNTKLTRPEVKQGVLCF